MDLLTLLKIQTEIIEKYQSQTNPNKKNKRKLHFDIFPSTDATYSKVFSPEYIKSHAFLPFISEKITLKKIKLLNSSALSSNKNMLEKHIALIPKHLTSRIEKVRFLITSLSKDPKVNRLLICKNGSHKYSTKKIRTTCKASNVDSLVYDYYAKLLQTKYEQHVEKLGIDEQILAYRSAGVNYQTMPYQHAANAFKHIAKMQRCVVFTFDVSSFFDNLEHEQLKLKWCQILDETHNKLPADHYNLFKHLTNYASIDQDEIYQLFRISKKNPRKIAFSLRKEMQYNTLDPNLMPVEHNGKRQAICTSKSLKQLLKQKKLKVKKNLKKKGIPQGISISNILSNIYMLDFDLALKEFTEQKQGVYYRYCDDVICIIPVAELSAATTAEQHICEFVLSLALKNHLKVNDDKTRSYLFIPEREIIAFCQPELNSIPVSKLRCINYPAITSALPPTFTHLQWLGFDFTGTKVTVRSSTIARFQAKRKKRIYTDIKAQLVYKTTEQVSGKKLRNKYTHFGVQKGKPSFVSYTYTADKVMPFYGIKRQMRSHAKEFEKRFTAQLDKAKK